LKLKKHYKLAQYLLQIKARNNMNLMDQHALVTGAGSGVGLAIAQQLDAQGCWLTLCGRNEAPLKQLAASLRNAQFVICDVTDRASLDAALSKARDKFGPFSIAIANAGSAEARPFIKLSQQDWQDAMGVNLNGCFNTFQAVLPDLLAQGVGRLIAVSSTAGLRGYKYASAYSAAKHGVIGLVKSLAIELGPKNITTNAVCPGFTDTPMLQRSIEQIMQATSVDRQQAEQQLLKDNPIGRFTQTEEVAAAVVFMCQTAACNGHALRLDGGAL
jgi:3-hydroxybutyrate dehydrogenase